MECLEAAREIRQNPDRTDKVLRAVDLTIQCVGLAVTIALLGAIGYSAATGEQLSDNTPAQTSQPDDDSAEDEESNSGALRYLGIDKI